jgi:hypothetical protein
VTSGRIISLLGLAGLLAVPSCNDNPAAYSDILGPSRAPPAEPEPHAGGSAGTGENRSGTGGTAGSSTGGTGNGEAGMGESGAGATGGSTAGKGGSAGSGMTAGTSANPPIDPNFSPACFEFTTTSGEEILKGTPCTSADPKLCYRPCGPNQVGWKTETCTAGVYAEGDCSFSADKDYSCYKIPDEIDEAACGISEPPAATQPCDAPLCMSCNVQGFYQDSGNDLKEGFCSCREADAGGVRRWTCASTVAWPCPFSQGC